MCKAVEEKLKFSEADGKMAIVTVLDALALNETLLEDDPLLVYSVLRVQLQLSEVRLPDTVPSTVDERVGVAETVALTVNVDSTVGGLLIVGELKAIAELD